MPCSWEDFLVLRVSPPHAPTVLFRGDRSNFDPPDNNKRPVPQASFLPPVGGPNGEADRTSGGRAVRCVEQLLPARSRIDSTSISRESAEIDPFFGF